MNIGGLMLVVALCCGLAAPLAPVRAADATPATAPADLDAKIARGKTLFISYGCGWCHADGGRKAGHCPQLMDSPRDDLFMLTRIATGSPGKMPAFGGGLNSDDLNALLAYIRSLKPETTQ